MALEPYLSTNRGPARPSSHVDFATEARLPSRGAALFTLLIALAAPSLSGCERSVNMATAQSPTWNATTIPYAGVREENRQYPDYSIINASILSSSAPGSSKPAAGGGRGAGR